MMVGNEREIHANENSFSQKGKSLKHIKLWKIAFAESNFFPFPSLHFSNTGGK